MKSIKYLFISIIVLFSVQEADACWDQEYELDYDMYSVINEQSEIYLYNYDYKSTFSKLNCEEWQQLTSPEIPYDDVYKVVYVMSLDDFNQVYTEREKTYDNEFLEWITKKDTDILEYLKIAKVNENMRNKLNSRWYYPSMKCESEMMLDEIAEKAMTTVATNYPETNEGIIVRGQCDTYKDYNVMDTDNWNNWHAYYVTEDIYK